MSSTLYNLFGGGKMFLICSNSADSVKPWPAPRTFPSPRPVPPPPVGRPGREPLLQAVGRGDDVIDPRVGIDAIVPVGTAVARGEPLLRVHAADPDSLAAALGRLETGCTIHPEMLPPASLVQARYGSEAAAS